MDIQSNFVAATNLAKKKEKKEDNVMADIVQNLSLNAFISIIIGITIGSFRCMLPGNNASTFLRTVCITTFFGTFWIVTFPAAGAYFTYKAFKGN